MLWKKSSTETGSGLRCSWLFDRKFRMPWYLKLGAASGGGREPCESSEVLDRCGEEELVVGASRTSQTKSIKTKLSLQVCEQHFDLLATAA